MIRNEDYILRSNNKHRHFENTLHPASLSTLLKTLQKNLKMGVEQLLSDNLFRVGARLNLLEKGESFERIMLRGG